MAGSNDKVRPSATLAQRWCGWRFAVVIYAVFLLAGAHRTQAAGVVGTGSAASCTDAALNTELTGGGLVTFNCGSAPVTIDISTGTGGTGTKTIAVDTTIDGGGLITLSGGGAVPIFTIDESAIVDVRNLTIVDGRGDLGGGIFNSGTLTLTNCALRGNSARVGGGIFNNLGMVALTNCTLRGNSAGGGGAILSLYGTLTLTNCTLSGNSAAGGSGGIANNLGGGIANFSGTLALTNCTLSDNSAGFGVGGSAIANDVVCQDIACSECGSVVVTNSTFSGNGVDTGAPGIGGPCSASLTNSIIANSGGANCIGSITDGGHNLQFPGASCGETIPSLDPLPDPAGLQDNGGPTQTIAVLPGSPAINAGDPTVCANPPVNGVDQRGHARPGTGHTQCSIGAYEADAILPETCVGDCDDTSTVTIDELLTMVNIALATAAVSECRAGDGNQDGTITVDEILTAVNAALNGCPAVPVEEGYFTGADGNRLFYRKLGAGEPTVVYLHGGPINMNDGGYDIDQLASGRTLLMFDQRSGGRSELVQDPARLQFDLFVADVEALRLHFGLEEMVLVGQSFGADVASNYAVQYPERVSRLMLWSPAPPTAEFAAARDAATRAFLGRIDARRADQIFYGLIPFGPDSEVVALCREWVQLTFQFYLSDPAALSRMHGDYCAGSPAAIRHQFRAISIVYPSLGAFDFRPGLRTLQVPTLIVEGALTRVPLDATEEWARVISDARILLVPGASHLLWLEGGEPFFQAAELFLSGQWPAAAVVLSP